MALLGEVITTAGSSVSAQFVGETIDVVLGNLRWQQSS